MKHLQKPKLRPLALAFALPCVGMLFVMLVSGYKPFGQYSMLYSDMYHQYYPFFVAFHRALRSGQSLLYSWDVGLGMDYLGLISYYLASPLNLLSVLVPERFLLSYFSLMMPVKLGLAGLFFGILLKEIYRKNDLSIAVFGGFYGLCAWALGFQWNIMWLDTFALLPLVVLGAVAVDLLHALLDLGGGHVLSGGRTALAPLDLGLLVGVHEDIQRLIGLQDHIRAPSHDDAVAALGKVLQDLALGHRHADGLVHDLEGRYAEPVTDGQGVGGLDALFGHMCHIILIKAILLGDHLDDLMVIAGDVQRLGQTLAQLTAAGAKFTADGDDTVHRYDLLYGMLDGKINIHSSCHPRIRGRWNCGAQRECAAAARCSPRRSDR